MKNPVFPALQVLCTVYLSLTGSLLFAKDVHYELNIQTCRKNLSGQKDVAALCINNEIPAPILRFNEGDTAVITVNNHLDEETSVHWHGILLPSEMDGVPYVSSMPILARDTRTFRFPLSQHGTYWYHSHSGLQEQRGVYGAIVIAPRGEPGLSSKHGSFDEVLVLSDWTDDDPHQVLSNLKKDGDYYSLRKKRRPSLYDAYQRKELRAYVQSELNRMGGMDLSDIAYDAFLVNGKALQSFPSLAGKRGRVRIINAAASTYFYLQQGGKPLTVVAADGIDVHPVTADEVLIGMGETYDVIIDVPQDKEVELRATAQDGSGYASALFGRGSRRESPPKRELASLYHMGPGHERGEHAAHGHASLHGQHTSGATVLTYADLKPLRPLSPAARAPTHTFRIELTGDMSRYNWFLNNKPMSEERSILINEGDLIRFQLVNETMMHHPMHLHGHFFKVLSGSPSMTAKDAAIKHTVDVPPHQTRVIEFYADAPGNWLFHCHNLYHMKSGMGRVVEYRNYATPAALQQIASKDPHLADHWYPYGRLGIFTNNAEAYGRMRSTHWQVDGLLTLERDSTFETEGLIHRWFGNYVNAFVGGTSRNNDVSPLVGVEYLLPLRIWSRASVDSVRGLGLRVSKDLALTNRLSTKVELDYTAVDKLEHTIFLGYDVNWHVSLGLKYDAKNKLSAGLYAQF